MNTDPYSTSTNELRNEPSPLGIPLVPCPRPQLPAQPFAPHLYGQAVCAVVEQRYVVPQRPGAAAPLGELVNLPGRREQCASSTGCGVWYGTDGDFGQE